MRYLALCLLLAMPALGQNSNNYGGGGTVPGSVCGDSSHALGWTGSAYNCQSITGSAAAGGSSGQIQWNNAGALAGFTMSGDCTTVTSTGAVTCTKTNGTAFGPLATQAGASSSAAIIAGLTFTPENSANKDAASGYAGLTAGSVLKIAEFPAFTAHSLLFGSGSAGSPSLLASPATNGNCVVSFNVTASGAVDPTCSLSGVTVNAQSASYSLVYSDRAAYLKFSGGTTATLTLCQITGTCASNLPFVVQNLNSGNLTIAANAADKIDNGATGGSATLLPNFAAFVYQDSSSAPGNWWTANLPTFAAFGTTCTTGFTWSTSTGFGCGNLTTQSVGDNSTKVATTAYVRSEIQMNFTCRMASAIATIPYCNWTLPAGVTITGMDAFAATAGSGCSTAAVIQMWDGTASAEIGSYSITIANATNSFTQVTGSTNVASGHRLQFKTTTAAVGCGTNPQDVWLVATYQMQN